MSTVRTRRTAHHGSVSASALAIDTRLVPEAVARRRVLELWPSILRVFRIEARLVVVFRAPVPMTCSLAPGTPLVRQEHLLSAAPLDADELELLRVAGDAVVFVEGGYAAAHALGGLAPEDVSAWLDLSPFQLIADVRALGDAIAEPAAAISPPQTDVRQVLGAPPPDDGARDVARALARRGAAGGAQSNRHPAGRPLVGVLSGLWLGLKAVLQSVGWKPRGRADDSVGRGLALREAPRRQPDSWLSRIRRALARSVASALLRVKLGALIGRRQARYLAHMLDLFEANQLDDALLHAVPLRGGVSSALSAITLGALSPRSSLAISLGADGVSPGLGVDGDLFQHLRQRYRRAFQQLAARGDIDKAVFVLAELLDANEEAVSFLEQHRKFALAARLAEGRALPPGLVIRLWCLAGDWARAIRIAHQTGAFADAVTRLESAHRKEAAALRLLWADNLASGGDYAAAVDVAWPVGEARHVAAAWLERGIEVGGATGARLLARKARLVPTEFSTTRDRVLALLRDPDVEVATRRALGHELTAEASTPETRALARATARRLVHDELDDDLKRVLRRLLDVAGDAALRADVRALSAPGRGVRRSQERVDVHAFASSQMSAHGIINTDFCVLSSLGDHRVPAHEGAYQCNAADAGLVLAVFNAETQAFTSMAAEALLTSLRNEFSASATDPPRWGRALAASVESANSVMVSGAQASPLHVGVTGVVTVATICDDVLLLAQLGDTRAYVLRGETLVQVTREHLLLDPFIEQARERGAATTQSEIDEFAHKRVVTRALGSANGATVDVWQVGLEAGDVIVLCSAGLWSVIDDERIRRALIDHDSQQAACEALLSMVVDAGIPYDTSVIVATFEGGGLSRAGSAVVSMPFDLSANDDRGMQVEPPLSRREVPVEIRRDAADRGAMEVLDAAELPDSRMLVALGEVGVWLLSRDGVVLTRFAEPASQIVMSDHGDRAILVMRRGESCRLSRVDLLTRQVSRWCDARFDCFATDFDGLTWFVARGDTVYAVSATSERWEYLWTVTEPGARVGALRRDAASACVWYWGQESGEVWRFELPSITLRDRRQILHADTRFVAGAVSPRGDFVGWGLDGAGALSAWAWVRGRWQSVPALPKTLPESAYVTETWFAVPVTHPERTTIHLCDVASRRERARIELEGARRGAGLRFRGDHLTVFDGRGRVIVVSLRSGEVLREHRIS